MIKKLDDNPIFNSLIVARCKVLWGDNLGWMTEESLTLGPARNGKYIFRGGQFLWWHCNRDMSGVVFAVHSGIGDNMNGCKLQNPNSEIPAVVKYYESGFVKEMFFYTDDQAINPVPHKPAHIQFWKSGKLSRERRLIDGQSVDGEDGVPGEIVYNAEGVCVGGHSSVHGRLSREQVAILVDKARQRLAQQLCQDQTSIVALTVGRGGQQF